MSTVVKGGTVVTATDTYLADLLVENGRVAAVGTAFTGDTVIEATGKYVIPGGIDAHTHFDMPFGGTNSVDDFESGTIAAAFGGTTTCIDFAMQPRGTSVQSGLETWLKKAHGRAAIDFGLHMILTEMTDQVQADMDRLIKHEGVTSFKLFMAYKGVLMMDDENIFRALKRTSDNGGLIQMHAENGGVIDTLVQRALAEGKTAPKYHGLTRPSKAEGEATHRAIALSEMAGVPIYIVHLSCFDALNAVREARDRGLPAYAETCPQYLFLSDENLAEPDFEGAKYVCSPPVREKWNQDELWTGLAKDDLQVISTDHCPFCFKEQKEMGKNDFSKIPNGLPGVEHRMSLVYDGGVRTGKISLNRYVQLTATAPAKVFGMYPRKGTIAVGSDADLVIFDPDASEVISVATHHMKVDYSAYEGRHVTGIPTTVLSRGKVVIQNGAYVGKPGDGQFVKAGLFQPPSCDMRLSFGACFMPDPPASRIVELTKLAEDNGFEYAWLWDSHVLWQEVYPIFALMAAATTSIRLGPCVTNPATRDPTVTASVMATLNDISGGRMDLGFGRGDSARRVIGRPPTSIRRMGDAAVMIRDLAAGKEVQDGDTKVQIKWAKGRLPVWIAAYGPQALRLAGELADGVILQIADPFLIKWFLTFVREGAKNAGRRFEDIQVMAAAPGYVTTDMNHAREQVRWFPALVSNHVVDLVQRYQPDDLPSELTEYINAREHYDYADHGRTGAEHAGFVTDEVVDRFCVLGPKEACIAKLEALQAVGVHQFNNYLMVDEPATQIATFGRDIIPAFA